MWASNEEIQKLKFLLQTDDISVVQQGVVLFEDLCPKVSFVEIELIFQQIIPEFRSWNSLFEARENYIKKMSLKPADLSCHQIFSSLFRDYPHRLYLQYWLFGFCMKYTDFQQGQQGFPFLELSGDLDEDWFLLGNWSNVRELRIQHTNVKDFPSFVREMTQLQILDASANSFEIIPDWIRELENIEEIYLHENLISEIPDSIFDLQNIRVLSLNENVLFQQDLSSNSNFLTRLAALSERCVLSCDETPIMIESTMFHQYWSGSGVFFWKSPEDKPILTHTTYHRRRVTETKVSDLQFENFLQEATAISKRNYDESVRRMNEEADQEMRDWIEDSNEYMDELYARKGDLE